MILPPVQFFLFQKFILVLLLTKYSSRVQIREMSCLQCGIFSQFYRMLFLDTVFTCMVSLLYLYSQPLPWSYLNAKCFFHNATCSNIFDEYFLLPFLRFEKCFFIVVFLYFFSQMVLVFLNFSFYACMSAFCICILEFGPNRVHRALPSLRLITIYFPR